MKKVVYWSPKKVADWLLENAMPKYCEPLEHSTGQDLINLTQEDFTKPPLCRVSSDNGQWLLDMIETLKMEHHMEAHKNGHANGRLSVGVDIPNPDGGSFSIKMKPNGMPNGRFFCIVGTLYLYRCIAMYVTTLPVPGMHFNCSPTLFGDWEAQVWRIMKLNAGGGLSITGSQNVCGNQPASAEGSFPDEPRGQGVVVQAISVL
ncbi:hypothetical protein NN561_019732 [Cricetulus griseus]